MRNTITQQEKAEFLAAEYPWWEMLMEEKCRMKDPGADFTFVETMKLVREKATERGIDLDNLPGEDWDIVRLGLQAEIYNKHYEDTGRFAWWYD